jgi:hypothetical protein
MPHGTRIAALKPRRLRTMNVLTIRDWSRPSSASGRLRNKAVVLSLCRVLLVR